MVYDWFYLVVISFASLMYFDFSGAGTADFLLFNFHILSKIPEVFRNTYTPPPQSNLPMPQNFLFSARHLEDVYIDLYSHHKLKMELFHFSNTPGIESFCLCVHFHPEKGVFFPLPRTIGWRLSPHSILQESMDLGASSHLHPLFPSAARTQCSSMFSINIPYPLVESCINT